MNFYLCVYSALRVYLLSLLATSHSSYARRCECFIICLGDIIGCMAADGMRNVEARVSRIRLRL